MMKKFVLAGSFAAAVVVPAALMVAGPAPDAASTTKAKGKASAAPAASATAKTAAQPVDAKKFVKTYCEGCHSVAMKGKLEAARHITLDDLDIDHPE
jgi:cytochrome c5